MKKLLIFALLAGVSGLHADIFGNELDPVAFQQPELSDDELAQFEEALAKMAEEAKVAQAVEAIDELAQEAAEKPAEEVVIVEEEVMPAKKAIQKQPEVVVVEEEEVDDEL